MFRFTPENAAEFGRKGRAAALAKRAAEKKCQTPSTPGEDQARVERVKIAIDKLLDEAEKAKTLPRRLKILGAMTDLWSLALPKHAPTKGRGRGRTPPAEVTPDEETPQPVVNCGAAPTPENGQTPQAR
jgi:hypothetical protein